MNLIKFGLHKSLKTLLSCIIERFSKLIIIILITKVTFYTNKRSRVKLDFRPTLTMRVVGYKEELGLLFLLTLENKLINPKFINYKTIVFIKRIENSKIILICILC